MRWPWAKEHGASPEAEAAEQQADRALLDAEALRGRAEEVARSLSNTRRVNHIAEAVIRSIRGA